jgi:hypothetical protein
MIDDLHSSHRTQEYRPFACWSAGTSKRATAPGVTAWHTSTCITEKESFVIELVVPESPTAQGSPAEEQEQPKDHDVEDKANESTFPE